MFLCIHIFSKELLSTIGKVGSCEGQNRFWLKRCISKLPLDWPTSALGLAKKELLSLVEKNDKSKALKRKRLRAAAFEEFSSLPAGLV